MKTPDDSDGAASKDPGFDTQVMQGALERRLFGKVAAPIRIGRFVVIDRLGEGGMGTVFRAYDPDLDRPVAVKLLKKVVADDPDREARLVREAKALAKLNHPNVVAVYDVGRVAERIFVAMEYIEGEELGAWAKSLPSAGSTRHALAVPVLVQAGTGLVAAHEAGLIHRDFKPSNVLMGKDGRARVVDFGLARAQGEVIPLEMASFDSLESSVTPAVTETGAVVGTPAYMAPEQWDRAGVTAAADQYAFCLTAWEVLFGRRPWDTPLPGSVDEIEAPSDRGPRARHLVRVLSRGLARDPAARFEGMDALLGALQYDPRSARRRWFLGGVGAAAVAVFAVGYAVEREHRCDDVRPLLADAQAQSISDAFVATGDPDGRDAFDRAWSALEGYGDRWTDLAQRTCAAARVEGTLSEDSYALTQRCLDDRGRRAEALLEALAQADRAVVRRSLHAVQSLPDLEACLDPDHVRAEAPLPEEGSLREAVLEARTVLARASAHWATGGLDEARALLEGLIEHEAVAGYLPLKAEVHVWRGRLAEAQNDGEVALESLQLAYWTGLEHRHDHAAARAARSLASHFIERNQLDAAQRWIESAEALTGRADAGDDDRSSMFETKAQLARRGGDPKGAEGLLREAMALVEGSPLRHAELERNLALIFLEQARFDEGRAKLEEVRDALQSALGPEHHEVASVLHNLGGVYSELGRPVDAAAAARRGMEIRQRTYGPQHPSVASSAYMLGNIAYRSGDLATAKSQYTEALRIAEASRPPGDPLIGRSQGALAAVLVDLGEHDAAQRIYATLLATRKELLGDENPKTARTHRDVGRVLIEMGRPADALEHLRAADVVFTKVRGPGHGQTLDLRRLLARALVESGRREDALRILDESVAAARENSDARPELGGLLGDRASLRLKLGEPDGALADSEEAVAIVRAVQMKSPDLIMAINRRLEVLVGTQRYSEATTLAETTRDADPVSRPVDSARLLGLYARALAPTDPDGAAEQAAAALNLYEEAGVARPPEVTALLMPLGNTP